jgi:ABC-type sugar transport system substrate-binding protein
MKCGLPTCDQQAAWGARAAALLKANLHVVPTGNSPDTVKAAFDSLLNANPKPDVVVVPGLEPSFWESDGEALAARGIAINTSSVVGESKAVVHKTWKVSDWYRTARMAAAYTVANGAGETVLLDLTDYSIVHVGFTGGFKLAFSAYCPSCKLDIVPVTAAVIGTNLPSQVVSYLRGHPQTKWVVGSIGDLLIGVPQALQAAGVAGQVRLVSWVGTPTNTQYVKAGEEAADVCYSNGEATWAQINDAALEMNHQTPQVIAQPSYIVTKSTVDGFSAASGCPGAQNFEAQFASLWNVR